MRVLVAPDSFGGGPTAVEVAAAVAEGWRLARPDDDVRSVPTSDGGEGLLEVLRPRLEVLHEVEVVDPLGLATTAEFGLLPDGTAVVESARACGLALVRPDHRDPLGTTTWGVGQLLDASRRAGATRVLVGLGGSATVDGGAGALSGLGLRLTVADGSGLKVFARELPRVAGAAAGWRDPAWDDLEVLLLADVTTVLADAPAAFGPQKGADAQGVAQLEAGLAALREVLERDLGADPALATSPGSGAAGGLAHGLAAGLPAARIVDGGAVVADLLGLPDAVAAADVVVTGEGRLDATSGRGKVVGQLRRLGATDLRAVVGAVAHDAPPLQDVEQVGHEPATRDALVAAAGRLARRWTPADA